MIHFVVLLCLLDQVHSDTNVALNKPVTYCGTKLLSTLITDGKFDLNGTERIFARCEKNSFIEIHLHGEFYIHYVVVYEGESNDYIHSRALNHFTVKLITKAEATHTCSIYPKATIGPKLKVGMRVNCNCCIRMIEKVRIISHSNDGFSIVEVEAYTIASAKSGEIIQLHHGCFEEFNYVKTRKFSNWSMCLRDCGFRRFPLAAIKNMETCYCGDLPLLAKSINVDNCNYKCDYNHCGGPSTYSVYIVDIQLPFYAGCFRIDENGTSSEDLTISSCLYKCAEYRFAGLKDGSQCLCLNKHYFPRYYDYQSCDIPCSGSKEQICGGHRYASLYNVRLQPHNMRLLNLFRCVGLPNENGACEDDCDYNFVGTYCLEYLITYCLNYNPCSNESNTECVVRFGYPTCLCLPGFQKHWTSTTCEDIDECSNFECEIYNSICSNTIGSFYCTCKEGYIPIEGSKFCLLDTETGMLIRYKMINYLLLFLLLLLPLIIAIFWYTSRKAKVSPRINLRR